MTAQASQEQRVGDVLAALRPRTEQSEVYALDCESTLVRFEANRVKAIESAQEQSIAARGLVGGRLGFTAATGPVAQSALIENLLASAAFGELVPMSFPAAKPAQELATYDRATAELPLETLVAIGGEIVDAVRQADDAAMVYVDLERSVERSRVCNSAGTDVPQASTCLSISITVERVRGDDVLLLAEELEEISLTPSYHEAVQRLVRKLELAKRSAKLKPGRMPVLFSPAGSAVLTLPLALALDGQNVQRGLSPLSDKLGQLVVDPQITLVDDPLCPARPASAAYDDEGVPCLRKALIEGGRCAAFAYDLRTAALMGTQSTGNAVRDVLSPPEPGLSNMIVEPGTSSLAEILAGIRHGLLVEEVLGLGQSNAMSGAYSGSLGLAYVIERGEVVGRVKDLAIAGDIYQDLKAVAAISRGSQWVAGDSRVPHILLGELKVIHREEQE